MKTLMNIMNKQSSHTNEFMMIEAIINELTKIKIDYMIDDCFNIIAVKGKTNSPCVCCHIDTVHPIIEGFKVLQDSDTLFGWDSYQKKQVGVGGDDKCGIVICLELLRICKNLTAVFFTGEEVGGVGSSNINLAELWDCKYVIEIDRKGNNDVIFEIGNHSLASEKFKEDVMNILNTKFIPSSGLFTDILNLKERGLDVSMMNISAGYYNPHTDTEYVCVPDMYKTYHAVKNIIYNLDDKYEHETERNNVWSWDF